MLNDPQQRHLRSVLRAFEEDLLALQAMVEGRQTGGVLFFRALVLSPADRATVLASIRQAQAGIKAIAKQLHLEQEEDNAAMLVVSQMTAHWANLVDCQSEKLKSYGEVDPQVAQALDPPVGELASLAAALAALFSSPKI